MSYRRQETEWPAGWLFDRLAEHFHGAEVFKDIDSIEFGDDFVEVITTAVQSCDVLLALIGDRWLTMTDDEGRRRIDNPDDYVRIEIEAALDRNVRVVPILIYGARMPRAQDVPPSLAGLVRRQALELSVSRFDDDVSRLLRVLDKTLAEARTRPAPLQEQAGTPPETRTPSEADTPPQTQPQIQTPPEAQSPVETRTPSEADTPPQTQPQIQTPPEAQSPVETRTPSGTQISPEIDTPAETPETRQTPPQETPRQRRATGEPRRPPPVVVAVAAVAVLLAVGTALWWWPRLTTNTGGTANTATTSPPASGPAYAGTSPSSSTSPTVNRPLLVWQSVGSPAATLSGPAAAAYKGQIWVVGGMGTKVRVYDPASQKWRDGPPLPAGLSYGALASDGQRLYYMGGIKDSDKDWRGEQSVYVLDSPDGSWREGPPLPEPRYSGAAVWDGHRLVFGGGTRGRTPRKATSAIWALTSGGWQPIRNLPSPREKLAAASDGNGTVWFAGGADVSARTVSDEVDQLQGSTVKQLGPLPKPVQGLTAVWNSSSGACVIGGSTTLPNATKRPTATVTCRAGTWPDIPQPTGLATSATLGDTAYVLAGSTMFALRFTS
jgi:hypothetical protein